MTNPKDSCISCTADIDRDLGDQYCKRHWGIRIQDELGLAISAMQKLQKMVRLFQPRCIGCGDVLTGEQPSNTCGECLNNLHDERLRGEVGVGEYEGD